eukprot:s47_g3.t1
MNLRQSEFAKGVPVFLYLSADASPQGSLEYFIVLEDRVSCENAGLIVEATDEERMRWCKESYLRTTCLPIQILGSGKATSAAKFEALASAVMLDSMWEGNPTHASKYGSCVIGYCSDFGPEANVTSLPQFCIQDLLKQNVANSGGLLALRSEVSKQRFTAPLQDEGGIIEDVVILEPEDAIVQQPQDPGPEPKSFFSLSSALMIPGVATKLLSDREQKDLIYNRQMQFAAGDVVAPLVPSSVASQLANKKSQVAKALKDVQVKTPKGAVEHLMLQHFRETVNHSFFYSLPVDLVRKLPMKQLAVALTSMLSVKGKPAQPSGTLPLGPENQSLPLQDRVPAPHQSASAFLGPLEDEHSGNPIARPPAPPVPPAETELDLDQLISHCQCDGLLVFKVADKNPHLKKRPLHSVDNLLPTEIAIRLYRAEKINQGDIQIFPTASSEVPLMQIFSGDPQLVIDHMCSWKLDAGFVLKPCGKAFQQRVACPLTLSSVDLQRNLKPTAFELFLELQSKGWEWKTWGGKAADLKKLEINLKDLRNTSFLMHGQLEVYYQTAFTLAQQSRLDVLQQLRPNQPAQTLLSMDAENPVERAGHEELDEEALMMWAWFLKLNMRRRGWKLTETKEMPGPGFVKMPEEYGRTFHLPDQDD